MDADLVVEPASPAHADRLVALFGRDASACFCRFWHFEGDRNAWLARCAFEAGANEAELRAGLEARSDEARGLVAIAADEPGAPVVGWMKLAPRASVPKLYEQRFYRGLPVLQAEPAPGTFAIGCMLVDPARRRRGVARALVAGAVRLAPAWGARVLEAFPRRAPEGAHDADYWMGPERAFLDAGFVAVHDAPPYPVLRRTL